MPIVEKSISMYQGGRQVEIPKEQLSQLSTVFTNKVVDVLVESFPQQLGYQSGPEREVAQEVVREIAPYWVHLDFNNYASGFPVIAGQQPTDGVFARVYNGLLDGALAEGFETDLVGAMADSIFQVLGADGTPVYVAIESMEGNPAMTVLNPGYELLTREGVHQTLSNSILEATDALGLNLTLENTFGNESLYGGAGNDTLTGYIGNDNLFGGAGNDVLTGVDPNSISLGLGEIDTLTGGQGADTFVLGDANHYYYSDADPGTMGVRDYALITDFNFAEDAIQLHGSINNYQLGASPVGLPQGTAIYANQSFGLFQSNLPELIAIVQGNTPSDISSISSNFTFV